MTEWNDRATKCPLQAGWNLYYFCSWLSFQYTLKFYLFFVVFFICLFIYLFTSFSLCTLRFRKLARHAAMLQLNGFFFGKIFYFSICLLKVQLYPCVYLFVDLHFFILVFSALKIFQGFSLNYINQVARTLRGAVDKLLNGFKGEQSHGQFYFWKAKLDCSLLFSL